MFLQEIWMTFYKNIADQGMQTQAVRMFIETSGKCAMHFDQEAKCVTHTGQLFHRFGEEGAQMFKKVYSLYSAFCTQPAFYMNSPPTFLWKLPPKKPKFNDVCILFKHSNFCSRVLEMHSKRPRFQNFSKGQAIRPPWYTVIHSFHARKSRLW